MLNDPILVPQQDMDIVKTDHGMRLLLSLWWQFRQDGGDNVPTRLQMDPCILPRPALPFMFIYERVGTRLRCRLAGTKMRDIFGMDATGRFIDELVAPQALPARAALFHNSLDLGMPVFYRGYLVPAGRDWRRFHRLLLPVAPRGSAQATQIMGLLRVFETPSNKSDLPSADGDGLISSRLLDAADCQAVRY